jgi:hypothetical protein
VNGIPLTGTGKHPEKRYFNGAPQAAARKVVSIINRSISGEKSKAVEYSTIGIDNAVKIVLIEVTRGVHRSARDEKGKLLPYTYSYFGWREKFSPIVIEKDDNSIRVEWKNIAIPARSAKNAREALEMHVRTGLLKTKSLEKARLSKTHMN